MCAVVPFVVWCGRRRVVRVIATPVSVPNRVGVVFDCVCLFVCLRALVCACACAVPRAGVDEEPDDE